MTEKELMREALLVQDACNLTGVVHSFSRTLSKLRELHPNEGTEFFNTHPVSVLFSSKIASLTGSELGTIFITAYSTAKELCV